MPGIEEVGRSDVEALLEARRELGPSYDAALVDSFAERIERAVAQRADSGIAESQRIERRAGDRDAKHLALGIVSLVAGIPITAISATIVDLPGLIVAWTGIVGVNVSYALRGRRRG